jgi:hypothetical protein
MKSTIDLSPGHAPSPQDDLGGEPLSKPGLLFSLPNRLTSDAESLGEPREGRTLPSGEQASKGSQVFEVATRRPKHQVGP